ncbi:unnamed protein product, partial [Prorocentrum cordatum]
MANDAGVPAQYRPMREVLNVEGLRTMLDIFNNCIHFLGPGDAAIQLPPGTRTCNLENSESGHLMLP